MGTNYRESGDALRAEKDGSGNWVLWNETDDSLTNPLLKINENTGAVTWMNPPGVQNPMTANLDAGGYSINKVLSITTQDETDMQKFHLGVAPYSGNPILANSGSETNTSWSTVWKEGTTYHMYYSYDPAGDGNLVIGHATSSDGKSWTKDSTNNPVLDVGTSGKFDETQLWLPNVWEEGGTWYMFYTGQDSSGNSAIGYATSSDGVSWTRANAGNPVLTGTALEWDENNIEIGQAIIKINSTYYLWYNTLMGTRQVGLATSTDLVNWTKDANNPIFDAGGTGRFCVSEFKKGDFYYLIVPHYSYNRNYSQFELYRCENPTFYSSEREFLGIIKTPSSSGWDSHDQDTPFVLTDDIGRNSFAASNGELWVYYSGETGGNWQMGLLRSAPGTANWKSKTPRTEAKARAYLSASQTNLTSGVWHTVSLDTVDYDPSSIFAPNAFTIKVPGYYMVTASALWDGADMVADKQFLISILVNSASSCDNWAQSSTGDYLSVSISDIVHCDVGDTLELQVQQNTGSDLLDLFYGTRNTQMAVHLLSAD